MTLGSSNRKTGPMDQIWILPSEVSPLDSLSDGSDEGVCGSCRFRGSLCYVVVGRAPQAVWRAWRRGLYRPCAASQAGRGRRIRVGAWGDPGAVPASLWRSLLSECAGWTGYTHAWRDRPELRAWLMASVDTPGERDQAVVEGWRTFRTALPGSERGNGEIFCPAMEEGGSRAICWSCGLCAGQARRAGRDVVVWAHGSRKGKAAEVGVE